VRIVQYVTGWRFDRRVYDLWHDMTVLIAVRISPCNKMIWPYQVFKELISSRLLQYIQTNKKENLESSSDTITQFVSSTVAPLFTRAHISA
jgi:hypothetical protein